MSAILTRGRDDEKADSASGAFLRDTGICWSGLVFVVSAQDSRRDGIDEKAPLERWEHHGAFDSAEDCERNLNGWRARAMDRFKVVGTIENKYLSESAIFSRCIASMIRA